MTTTDEDIHEDVKPARQKTLLAFALAVTVPGIVFRIGEIHVSGPVDALIYGMAIVGAAFILSWAAEAAQLDISAGLAIAAIAFIAVLPEYAVDLVFARKGGNDFERFGALCQSAADQAAGRESNCSLALANMTGANRLLIGVGWSAVVFVAWFRYRKRRLPFQGIELSREHAVEIAFLSIATMYSLTLPLKRSITLVDAAILVAIFVAYTIRISRAPAEEPHLVGPARWVGSLPTQTRRTMVVVMLVVSAAIILLTAEHFAEALVESGAALGVPEFFLVQWLAPLASEAPELLIAILYAWRLNTSAGLGTLVSSKVNQWTLLVGTLPIAFALSSGSVHGLPIIARQREEVLLTAAQSFFALAVLLNRSMSVREAWILFVLFWTQFIAGAVVPDDAHGTELVAFSVAYMVLGIGMLVANRRLVKPLFRDGIAASYAELSR